jgi:hypothetical protein
MKSQVVEAAEAVEVPQPFRKVQNDLEIMEDDLEIMEDNLEVMEYDQKL